MSEFLNPQEITALSRAMLRSRWDEARDKAALVRQAGTPGGNAGRQAAKRVFGRCELG